MGVNGLEAANGWTFSQSSNGVSHIEYKVTISQHVTKRHTSVTCIGINKQSNLSDYATTCIVTT